MNAQITILVLNKADFEHVKCRSERQAEESCAASSLLQSIIYRPQSWLKQIAYANSVNDQGRRLCSHNEYSYQGTL